MSMQVSSEEFADMISEDTQHMVADLSYKVFNGVTRHTPVRTGQTRASWNMSKDKPNYSTIDSGDGLGIPDISKLKFRVGEYPLVFIANGKGHIGYLEHGSSKQAPNGMVAVTLASIS